MLSQHSRTVGIIRESDVRFTKDIGASNSPDYYRIHAASFNLSVLVPGAFDPSVREYEVDYRSGNGISKVIGEKIGPDEFSAITEPVAMGGLVAVRLAGFPRPQVEEWAPVSDPPTDLRYNVALLRSLLSQSAI